MSVSSTVLSGLFSYRTEEGENVRAEWGEVDGEKLGATEVDSEEVAVDLIMLFSAAAAENLLRVLPARELL